MTDKNISDEEDRLWKRAQLLQDYQAIREYAKAPNWRRAIAGVIDLGLATFWFTFTMPEALTWFPFIACVAYMLFRDCLMTGAGPGKYIAGLKVYDHTTLKLATRKQMLIRGIVYSTICLALTVALTFFAVAAILIVPLGLLGIIAVLSRSHFLAGLGYDPEDGRTIPDDWANTHVLPLSELKLIRDYEAKIKNAA